jgi:hypothetical protein
MIAGFAARLTGGALCYIAIGGFLLRLELWQNVNQVY